MTNSLNYSKFQLTSLISSFSKLFLIFSYFILSIIASFYRNRFWTLLQKHMLASISWVSQATFFQSPLELDCPFCKILSFNIPSTPLLEDLSPQHYHLHHTGLSFNFFNLFAKWGWPPSKTRMNDRTFTLLHLTHCVILHIASYTLHF